MSINFKPVLEGSQIQLLEFSPEHLEGLEIAASHDKLWAYFKPEKMTLAEHIADYLDEMSRGHEVKDPFAYTIVDIKTQYIVGSTRYYEISPADKRVCIGYTWYSPEFWGTKINPEAKFLLLSQIFEDLKWNRVAFHIDSRNHRSLSAVSYLGANQEGLLRQHKIVQDTFVRDTALFSIVAEDWPAVKEGLLERINA